MERNWTRRVSGALWSDRGKLLASFGAAILLWVLVGQKVEETQTIQVEVRCVAADDNWPQGSGLFIRIPGTMAVSDFQPKTIDLTLSGTSQDLARLERTVRGTYEVPHDFLGDRERETRELEVTRKGGPFSFARLSSLPTIDLKSSGPVVLTLSRRHVVNLSLGLENLAFVRPEIAADLEAAFEPTLISVSGPADRTRLLADRPGLFRLAEIDEAALNSALLGQLVVPARLGEFTEPERLKALRVEDRLIKIKLTQKRFRTVVLADVEVVPLIPKTAWRDGVDRSRPLSITPDVVTVTLRIPEGPGAPARDEAQIRKELTVFVNLGELSFSVAAGDLPVRFEGAPPGAAVNIEPRVIDVEWNVTEVPEESG